MDGKLHGNKICCDKGRSPGDSFTVQRNLRLVYSPFISKRDVYLSVYLKATSSCRIAIIFNHFPNVFIIVSQISKYIIPFARNVLRNKLVMIQFFMKKLHLEIIRILAI